MPIMRASRSAGFSPARISTLPGKTSSWPIMRPAWIMQALNSHTAVLPWPVSEVQA